VLKSAKRKEGGREQRSESQEIGEERGEEEGTTESTMKKEKDRGMLYSAFNATQMLEMLSQESQTSRLKKRRERRRTNDEGVMRYAREHGPTARSLVYDLNQSCTTPISMTRNHSPN
jgi:hypothetical protein